MTKEELVLAVLAAADGQALQPVQLQKAVFLLVRNIPADIRGEADFDFSPYDYGPYDKAVYHQADNLALSGLVSVSTSSVGRYRLYAATLVGVQEGRRILTTLPSNISEYIGNVVRWVCTLSFADLVKSIYEAYPEMKANSIFRG